MSDHHLRSVTGCDEPLKIRTGKAEITNPVLLMALMARAIDRVPWRHVAVAASDHGAEGLTAVAETASSATSTSISRRRSATAGQRRLTPVQRSIGLQGVSCCRLGPRSGRTSCCIPLPALAPTSRHHQPAAAGPSLGTPRDRGQVRKCSSQRANQRCKRARNRSNQQVNRTASAADSENLHVLSRCRRD